MNYLLEDAWVQAHGESRNITYLAQLLGKGRHYVYDRLRAGDYVRLANGNISIRSAARHECAGTKRRKA